MAQLYSLLLDTPLLRIAKKQHDAVLESGTIDGQGWLKSTQLKARALERALLMHTSDE